MITVVTENNIIDISIIETSVNVNSIKSNVVQVTTDNNIIDVSVEKPNITVNPVGEVIVQAFPAGLKGDKGDKGDTSTIQEIEDISGEIPLGTHFIYKKTTDFKKLHDVIFRLSSCLYLFCKRNATIFWRLSNHWRFKNINGTSKCLKLN